MPGSWPPDELPYLTDENCRVVSNPSNRYNCIAWAAGNDLRNWWPDPWDVGYWPPGILREVTVDAFMRAYGTLGYTLCFDDSLEAGVEKIAIYGTRNPDGSVTPTHAALQLESGKWTSKLGPFEDVRHHTADDVRGPVYGTRICCMSRPRP